MIFNLSSSDHWNGSWADDTNKEAIRKYLLKKKIELNSLEELIDFVKEIKCEIVVMLDVDTPEIEIYNGYGE